MFGKAVFYIVGCLLQFVSSYIRFFAMQAVARTNDDVFASLYELLLFTFKHTPPYYVGVFALGVGSKAMKRAAHIVERQHTVFMLNVLNDGTPMLMIVELRAEHLKTETEHLCLLVGIVDELNLASSYLILVVDETSQDMSAKRETVVVVLLYGTKLGILNMASKFYPNGIVGIVEEYGRSWHALFYAYVCVILGSALYGHDTFRPRVSGKQIVFSHITLGLAPNPVELGTFYNHCKIYVLNRQ